MRAEGRMLGLEEMWWGGRCSATGPGAAAAAGGREPGRPGGGSSSQEVLAISASEAGSALRRICHVVPEVALGSTCSQP